MVNSTAKIGAVDFSSKDMLEKSSHLQNGIIREELARRRDELAKTQDVFLWIFRF